MEEITPRTGTKQDERPDGRGLRQVLIIAGLALAVLILVAVAVYAGAFMMLAPMMQ